MKNELVSMYETQNKENPLTETQKLFAIIDGYMPDVASCLRIRQRYSSIE